MALTNTDIKRIKQALTEENIAGGIQPTIIPPPADQSIKIDVPVKTQDVIDSLL